MTAAASEDPGDDQRWAPVALQVRVSGDMIEIHLPDGTKVTIDVQKAQDKMMLIHENGMIGIVTGYNYD